MDLGLLRERTRAAHESAEAALPLMEPGLTRERYREVLQAMLPVVRAWDRWSMREAPAEVRGLMEGRQRSALLEADLKALGGGAGDSGGDDAGEPEFAAAWARAGSAAEREAAFLGAMYVMEGSTLGGQFVARHVEEALGLEEGVGDAYFRGYGAATGERWRGFREVLGGVPEELAEVVTDAARAMFVYFEQGVRRGLAAERGPAVPNQG